MKIRSRVFEFELREKLTIDVTFVPFEDSDIVIAFDCVVGVFCGDRDRFLREPHHSDEITEVDCSIDVRWKVVDDGVESGTVRVEVGQYGEFHSTVDRPLSTVLCHVQSELVF
jgi:hypothetical protein